MSTRRSQRGRNHAPLWTSCALAMCAFCGLAAGQQKVAGEPGGSAVLYDRLAVLRTEPGTPGTGFRVRMNNNLEAVNTTLVDIAAFAYNVHPKRIVNAPRWASEVPFDLTLHYAGDAVPDDATCKQMLKDALRERFGLVLHGGGAGKPGYAIHVEPAGPKLASSMALPGALPALAMPEPGKLQAHNASVADLAATLQRSVLDRPVVDETGITGRWDFDLTWAPSPAEYAGHVAGALPDTGKSLAERMKGQLGLRLDPATAPPSNLIVDQVHLPDGI